MRYSEDLIEEIRMKNDIVDVISGYVKLQRRGSSYFGLCPFHNEKSPSFSVSPDKQMYYCNIPGGRHHIHHSHPQNKIGGGPCGCISLMMTPLCATFCR